LGRVEERASGGRRLAWKTAVFSVATGLSRILGLIREIVAAYYFGATGKTTCVCGRLPCRTHPLARCGCCAFVRIRSRSSASLLERRAQARLAVA
jgi:hypothetical protein